MSPIPADKALYIDFVVFLILSSYSVVKNDNEKKTLYTHLTVYQNENGRILFYNDIVSNIYFCI